MGMAMAMRGDLGGSSAGLSAGWNRSCYQDRMARDMTDDDTRAHLLKAPSAHQGTRQSATATNVAGSVRRATWRVTAWERAELCQPSQAIETSSA